MYDRGIQTDGGTFCQGYAVDCSPACWYGAFKHKPNIWVDTQRFVDYGGSITGRYQMIADALSSALG